MSTDLRIVCNNQDTVPQWVNASLSQCALIVKELRCQLAVTMCLLLFQLINPLDELQSL